MRKLQKRNNKMVATLESYACNCPCGNCATMCSYGCSHFTSGYDFNNYMGTTSTYSTATNFWSYNVGS